MEKPVRNPDGAMLKSKIKSLSGLLLAICVFSFLLYARSFSKDKFVYDAKGRRNPFIPLVSPEGVLLKLDKQEDSKKLAIEGIIYDKHGLSFAITNGKVVKIGDRIGDYQVLKIEKNKVIFVKDAELTEIELKKEER